MDCMSLVVLDRELAMDIHTCVMPFLSWLWIFIPV